MIGVLPSSPNRRRQPVQPGVCFDRSSSLTTPPPGKDAPARRFRSWLRSSRAAGGTALIFFAAAIAIWWRNHDIIRDLYDASSIIVAVGKLEAGLRPYVDFRSTMQSATYVLNWAAEAVFGNHYLGLVKGGLALTLLGGALLMWLWRGALGAPGAVMLAGAVMVGGLSQHVFVFYNPLGLLCLAIVLGGLAANPKLWPLRTPEAWFVCAALVIGGANKINFHALTLGLAALLVLRPWCAGERRGGSIAASLGLLAFFGVVIPLALELAWTGASLRTWAFNILELPTERLGFALAGFTTDLLWKPPYDVHHSVLFKPLSGVGLLLVAAATGWSWVHGVRPLPRQEHRFYCSLLLVATGVAVAIGGLLLTTTNVETIALTSLAFPVGAAAILAAYRPVRARSTGQFAAVVISMASLPWTLVGGYAAWHGSRVMFGEETPVREHYRVLDNPSPSVAYFSGVRMEPGWRDSLLATVKELERIEVSDPTLSTVLFGPAFEWMERAHPATILPGMPVWFHHGTSLSSDDGPWLESKLSEKGVNRIVLNPHWESWPGSFWLHLAKDFRDVDLGRFARIYERKTPGPGKGLIASTHSLHPWSFRAHTGSNVHWSSTLAPPNAGLFESPWGPILGRVGGLEWTWKTGPYLAQGNIVTLLREQVTTPINVTCLIVGLDGETSRVLFEETVTLSSDRPEVRLPFQISAGGAPLRLSFSVADGLASGVVAGWRDVRIGHAGPAEGRPPAVLQPFATIDASPTLETPAAPFVRLAKSDPAQVDGWYAAPFEVWQPVASDWQQAAVTVEIQRRPDGRGHPTLLTLAWYKAGRIEFLQQTVVNPTSSETITLSAGLPESGGWLGLIALAADPTASPNIRIRPPQWNP